MPKAPTTDAEATTIWNAEAKAIRQLAMVIRAVLKAHPDETSGEVAALVKDRLRALKLPWTPAQLHAALSILDRRPVTRPPPVTPPPEMAQQVDPPWRTRRPPSSGWTSIGDLGRDLLARSKRPSDPST
jgi:hypothetical protein